MDRAKAAARATDEYVRDNPWQALGVAAAVGFLIGLVDQPSLGVRGRHAATRAAQPGGLCGADRCASAGRWSRCCARASSSRRSSSRRSASAPPNCWCSCSAACCLALFALLFASVVRHRLRSGTRYRLWAIGGVTLFYVVLAVVVVMRLQQAPARQDSGVRGHARRARATRRAAARAMSAPGRPRARRPP